MRTGKNNPVKISEIKRMRSLREQGMKVVQIAIELGRHHTVVSQYTKDLRKKPSRVVPFKPKKKGTDEFFDVDEFSKSMLL